MLGKSVEQVTEGDINLVVELLAQQIVLSDPEMQYDNSVNSAVDYGNEGVVNPTNDEFLKLLGEG